MVGLNFVCLMVFFNTSLLTPTSVAYLSAFFKKVLKIKYSEIHWVNNTYNYLILKDLELKARIRYRQKLQDINVEKFEDFLYVKFKEFQSAITPGQFVAIYQKNQLIASGVIL